MQTVRALLSASKWKIKKFSLCWVIYLHVTKMIFTRLWQIWGLTLTQEEEKSAEHIHRHYLYYFFFSLSLPRELYFANLITSGNKIKHFSKGSYEWRALDTSDTWGAVLTLLQTFSASLRKSLKGRAKDWFWCPIISLSILDKLHKVI